MNFSQFSQNKLDKEQMMEVKGGLQRIFKTVRTLQPNGCYYISEGYSVENADGSWGWEQTCGCWEYALDVCI
ncbi:MAG TPA: hypothetical protein DCR35_13545 [Runella sp.]|nr:hypothetical protein [Runella sp.]HAO50224.1 hypothetical protein [Runella sp.]